MPKWHGLRFSLPEDTPVDDKDYQVPFRFTGKIGYLTVKVDQLKLTQEEQKKLMI